MEDCQLRAGGGKCGRRGGDVDVRSVVALAAVSLESARKLFRRRSGSRSPSKPSIARWVLFQTGTARASNLRPFGVNVIRRARRSCGSGLILSRARRRNGLRAAVKVVRSMASSDATSAIPGGFGRFKDIMSENCPFVRPNGRNASSNRLASALAARCT